MKTRDYIKDKKYLIGFYFLLMIFLSSGFYLDPSKRVSLENILYINTVSGVFFLIYLLGGYIYRRNYFRQINDAVGRHEMDILNYLPEPKNYEQKIFNGLFKNMYEEQREKIEKLYEDKKENQEYVDTWVHEVKTPISVLRLILENSGEKSKEEILGSIEEELDKIENQVEQALYYSRIDDFSKDYFIKEAELEKLVKEGVKRQAKTFINKRIKIDIGEGSMSVLTDRKWLMFIIDQILANSLKYTGESGKIGIVFEEDTREKRLAIEDNGIGIPPEDLDRVFEKSFTGIAGRQHYKSTGMGLYLAKKLCKKLGHDISIESEYGRYTRVVLHFPKHDNYLNVTKM